MPRGDLRAPAAACQLLQRLLERQARLLGIPAAGTLRRRSLAAVQLHSKTGETERQRPILIRFAIVGLESVTRRLLLTTGTQFLSLRWTDPCPSAVQWELTIILNLR